jgi:hypothetical protein
MENKKLGQIMQNIVCYWSPKHIGLSVNQAA